MAMNTVQKSEVIIAHRCNHLNYYNDRLYDKIIIDYYLYDYEKGYKFNTEKISNTCAFRL